MPAISQIGFGTNDYANIASWLAAEENNDYSGAGPIAEISSAAPQVLSADFSFRYGTATKYTVRAATGSEFNGNSDGSHAKISSAAAQRIYIRKPNVKFENIEISSNISFTSDDFTGLEFAGCYLHYIEGREINATVTSPILFTDCILVQDADTYNRTLQLRGGADSIFTRCTIIARSGTGSIGALYVRDATTDVVINQTAIYASAGPSLANHGDAPAPTGDNNAAHDALLPGAGSIATLTTADFVDYANGDYRLKEDSAPALMSVPAGAFIQAPVVEPTLTTPTSTSITTSAATLGATTDISSGTFYGVVDSAANISGITGSQIIDGNNANDVAAVASNSSTVSTTSPTVGVTGLTAGTLYSYAVVQNDGSDSNVLTGTFTTAAAGLTASITSITDPITTGGSATITGTGFDTTQGTGFVTQEGIAVTETGWSDTSVIITSLTVESTVTKYGTQTFLLENDDGNSDTITADVDPASGNSYVDLAGTLATSGDRITATGDLVASDQLRYQNVLWQSGSPTAYTVSVDATGLFTIGNGPVPAGEYTFEVRAWDSTAPGWGTAADQTVNVAAPGPVITGSASHNVAENSAFSYDYTVAPMLGELPTISGPDVLLFTWVAQGSDVYRLGMTAKNYESPTDANADNVYSVTITADDLVNTPVTLDVNVTVTNVIEQTIVDGGDLVVEVPYGETGLAKTDALFTNWLATYSNATSNTAGSLPDTLLISNGAYTVTFSLADANDIDGDFTVTEAAAIAPSLPATLERTVTNGNNSITFAAATGTPTITYVLGGTDAALFDLVGLTATLITGEFDESTKSSYALTLTASSAHGDDAVQTITVTVIEDYPRDAELTELGWLTFYPADAYPRATLTGSGWETNYPVNPHQEATLTEDGWEVDEIE